MARLSLRDIWRKCLDTPANAVVWEELLARIYPNIRRIARNVACNSGIDRREDIEDLIQDICAKISHPSSLRSIRPPEADDEAELYFRAIAANAARDSLKTRFAGKRGERLTVSMEQHLTELADAFAVSTLEIQILVREIDENLDATTKDRGIFWLYYRQGLTSKEIAAIPAIELSLKGVESALQRMTASLRIRLNTTRTATESKSGTRISSGG